MTDVRDSDPAVPHGAHSAGDVMTIIPNVEPSSA